MTSAESYLIHQTDKEIEKALSENKEKEDLVGLGINLLIGVFSIKQIGIVSAVGEQTNQLTEEYNATTYAVAGRTIEDINWNCCLKAKNGAICQDVASTIASDVCDGTYLPTKCEEVTECKIGCCFDNEQGLCTTKSPKAKCEINRGNWFDNEACLIDECQKGCCVLGSDVEFVTEKRCGFLSSVNGFQKDFRDYQTELECLILKETQKTGACIINSACSIKVEIDCKTKGGNFYEDKLCSAPSLETNCTKQKSFRCTEGKDGVYWFDSCGNRENIYSSDKDASWSNGNLLSKNESCNPNSSNINSNSCGNCNYFLGSKCASNNGNARCINLNCLASTETGNKERKNGESWCVYDSFIGEGKDTVGSRHWKRMCIDGEVKVEPCADYRGQICVQADTDLGNNEKISTATCVINRALECVNANNKDPKKTEKNCKENPQCQLTKVDVSSTFKFSVCTAKYPAGFDLSEDNQRGNEAAKQLCSMATQECTVLYEKKATFPAPGAKWVCVSNCECLTKKFAEEMNNLCIAMGDCGNYVNFVGDGTDNSKIKMKGSAPDGKKAEPVSWKDYIKYAKPVDGQKAEPDSLEYTMKRLGFSSGNTGASDYSGAGQMISLMGTIVGSTGTILTATAAIQLAGGLNINAISAFVSLSTGGATIAPGAAGSTLAGVGAGFSAAAIGAGIGALVGGMIAKWMGLSGQGAMLMTLGGAIVGAGVGMVVGVMYFGLANFWNPVGWILIIVGLVLMIAVAILGIGKTKKVVVQFKCLPWEAPTGAANCEKCNENPLKPCSEYRCSSLGQACKLENKDTTNPICVADKNDGTPPIISIGEIIDGYKFIEKSNDEFEVTQENGECVPEFTTVPFSLKTNEYAQCKWDYKKTNNYENMGESFAEENSYTKNHTNAFMTPSLSSLEAEYNISISGDVREQFANPIMYVRCQDGFGNYNKKEFLIKFCVKSGPDLTQPVIQATTPVNKAILRYGTTEIPFIVYVNEPAECKFDYEDKNYSDMTNNMNCMTSLEDVGILGWPCFANLTGLNQDENKVYIKCKDQPWLIGTQNESNRNVNTNSFIYTLYSSRTQLKIDSISPRGAIFGGFEPVSVDLKVETSGGINNGVSVCSYSFSDEGTIITFFDSNSNSHEQTFSTIMSGDYKIKIMCKDDAGNEAFDNTNFSVNIDSSPPVVVRAYNSGGQLTIITNEEGKCYYDFERCNFNIANATSMTTGLSKIHTAEWKLGKTYYIKCEDKWNNINPMCAIKIMPTMFS